MFQVNFGHLLQISFLLFLLYHYSASRNHKNNLSRCNLLHFLFLGNTHILALVYIDLRISQHSCSFIRIIFHKEICEIFKIFSIILDIFSTGLFFNFVFEPFNSLLDNRVTVELFNIFKITVIRLINMEQGLCFDVTNKTRIFSKYDFDDELQEESYSTIEIIFNLGLSPELFVIYLPGRCFWSKNHLLPYSPYLL